MTQTQERVDISTAAERAERIVSRAGERLGMLAGRAAQRFQQTAQAFREKADQADIPASAQQKGSSTHVPSAQTYHQATERAEEMVERFGQRVSHWTQLGNMQARRTLARLREDAEDMWVEAQGMHHEWSGKRE
jgi:hypothetical protein